VKLWAVLSTACILLVLAQHLRAQDGTDKDEITQSIKSCNIIWDTLHETNLAFANAGVRGCPQGDDFAAGKACGELVGAIATSDSARIQRAVEELRPILALSALPPSSPREQLAALEKKARGLTGIELFYELPDLGKRAFNAGEIDKAQSYAKELLRMAQQYRKDWNYGNAIFYGNFVLGRISVRQGDFTTAGQYLVSAGATPGSPQLESFGPNMTLAKELVEKNQSDVVLRYLVQCKRFWKMDDGKLEEWSALIRGGEKPDFSDNLDY